MGTRSSTTRTRRQRTNLRRAGLRPVEIRVPDTRRPAFAKECRRQSRLVAKADRTGAAMRRFLDEALADIDGWVE